MALKSRRDSHLVYVVDDSASYGYLLSKALKIHGFNVSTFSCPQLALENLDKDMPSLILSDIEMPEIDGFQFYRLVRKKYTLSEIPFLFISSTDSEQYKMLAKTLTKNPLLRKPISMDSLVKAVTLFLKMTAIKDPNKSLRVIL